MFPYVRNYDPTACLQYLIHEDRDPFLSTALTLGPSPADKNNDFFIKVLTDTSDYDTESESDYNKDLGLEALPAAGDLMNGQPTSSDSGVPDTVDLEVEVGSESTVEIEVEAEVNGQPISSDSWVPDTVDLEVEVDSESTVEMEVEAEVNGQPTSSDSGVPDTVDLEVEVGSESTVANEVKAEVYDIPLKCNNDQEVASPLKQIPVKRSRGRPRSGRSDQKQMSNLSKGKSCGSATASTSAGASASTAKFGERNKRVRGRPRGKPPKLNLQQRRERNAELERERRAELGDSYEMLRIALGGNPESCDSHADELSREKLLVEAIKALKKPSPEVQIRDLRRQNSLLQMQIERLQGEG